MTKTKPSDSTDHRPRVVRLALPATLLAACKLLVRCEKLHRSFITLNHIAAATIAFRKVPLTINVIYG